jgi:hypothetical protein
MWVVSLLFIVLLLQLYVITTQQTNVTKTHDMKSSETSVYRRALSLDKKKALPLEIRESLLSIVNDSEDDSVLLALMNGNDFGNSALTELLALQP